MLPGIGKKIRQKLLDPCARASRPRRSDACPTRPPGTRQVRSRPPSGFRPRRASRSSGARSRSWRRSCRRRERTDARDDRARRLRGAIARETGPRPQRRPRGTGYSPGHRSHSRAREQITGPGPSGRSAPRTRARRGSRRSRSPPSPCRDSPPTCRSPGEGARWRRLCDPRGSRNTPRCSRGMPDSGWASISSWPLSAASAYLPAS